MRRGDRTENVCRSETRCVTRNAVVKSVQNMPHDLTLQNTRPKTLATADPPTMMSMMPTSALSTRGRTARPNEPRWDSQ